MFGTPSHRANVHTHKCPDPKCAVVWSHDAYDLQKDVIHELAHHCPKCGKAQFYKDMLEDELDGAPMSKIFTTCRVEDINPLYRNLVAIELLDLMFLGELNITKPRSVDRWPNW
jgi:hypothetical protein